MPALHGVLRWLKQGVFKGPSCSPSDMKQAHFLELPRFSFSSKTRGNKALAGKAYALIADSYFNTLYSFMFYILPWWVGRLSLNAKHCRCYQQSNSQITKQRAPSIPVVYQPSASSEILFYELSQHLLHTKYALPQ